MTHKLLIDVSYGPVAVQQVDATMDMASSSELQQTAKSVATDSQLQLQSVGYVYHTVVYPFSHGKGQCSVCPGTCASSCLFHDHLHQIVSLVARVSSLATNSQLSCKISAWWLTRLFTSLQMAKYRMSQRAQAVEPIISWPSSSNCQLSCGEQSA